MRRRGRRSVVAAAVLAFACTVAPAHAATPLVRASVNPSSHATKVARHFLGFSMEYRGLLRSIGNSKAGVNNVAAQLFANLASAGQGEPGLRIGGGTADSAWWNPTAQLKPNGVEIDLGPFARDSIASFEQATRAPLILDLNFAADRVAYARDWARALLPALPAGTLEALEIGNEPDVYATGRPFGTLPRTRPKGYSLKRYARELTPFTKALRRLRGHPRLAAPSTCCGRWDTQTAKLVRSQHGRLGLLSFHAYATNACPNATPKDRTTLDNLLGDATFHRIAARLTVIRDQAKKAHRRVQMTETNSASCGGVPGITDTYASSLWMTDWLFLMAAQGVAGVNVHTAGNYTPFLFGYDTDHFTGVARASYYGMLLFSRAIADHARLLVRTTLGARTRGHANVHVWATADRSGHARIVVVNKDRHASGDAVISVPDGAGPGTLERLTAPSLDAKTGIALGGLSVPDGTTDGRLTGAPVSDTVGRSGHAYRFAMPPASAALLTVSIPQEPAR
jgi:hypothetical protein